MEKSRNDVLSFIYSQKYILIILLIVSLILSYLIKKNEEFLGLSKTVEKRVEQPKKVKYTDYIYQIWYERLNGHNLDLVIGTVFDELGIDKFKYPNNARVINRRQTNKYNYFHIKTLDPIDENFFMKKIEIARKNYIQNELEMINKFRSSKNDKNILNLYEFRIFKSMNTKINLKGNIRVREMKLSKAEDEIKNLGGNEKHRSNNVELIFENNENVNETEFKVKKTFYYPEIIILLTYIGYFSLHFFIRLVREND